MGGRLARKLSFAALLLAACGTSDGIEFSREGTPDASADARCVTGSEHCECYGNGTCNSGLICASKLCVHVSDEDGATGSGGKRGGPTGAGGGSARGGSLNDGGPTDGGPIADSSLPGNGSGGRGGACTGSVKSVTAAPQDILILFDQSLSMLCMTSNSTRWDTLKKAVQDYVLLPALADVNVGLQYFGLSILSSCNAADYQTPDVEIAPLSTNATPIANSLAAHMPSTNTPTAAALTGAINHVIDWKNAHAGRRAVVLLVTDGQPSTCGMVSDVVTVASAGLMNAVPTYVIGVISPGITCAQDQNPPNQQDLDSVAKAGGTTAAHLIDTTKDVAQQFDAAMNDIRAKSTVACTFAIPAPPAGQALDPNRLNVRYTPAGSTNPIVVPSVTGACDPQKGGWYVDNYAAPTTIELCPSTCASIGASAIEVEFGCARRVDTSGGTSNGGQSSGGSPGSGGAPGGSSNGGSSSGGRSSGGSSNGGSSGAGGSNCPGYPTNDACSQCICKSCSVQVQVCVASSDTAKNDVCKQVQACAEQKHCTGSPCYCSQSATDPLCVNPDGPCAGVIQAAAGSGATALTIQQLGNDSTHPLGRAQNLEKCEVVSCRTECALP